MFKNLNRVEPGKFCLHDRISSYLITNVVKSSLKKLLSRMNIVDNGGTK